MLVNNIQENIRRPRPLSWVMDFTNLSKQSIYRLMAENDFPRQINLGARKVAWLESEVRAWLDHRIEASKAS